VLKAAAHCGTEFKMKEGTRHEYINRKAMRIVQKNRAALKAYCKWSSEQFYPICASIFLLMKERAQIRNGFVSVEGSSGKKLAYSPRSEAVLSCYDLNVGCGKPSGTTQQGQNGCMKR